MRTPSKPTYAPTHHTAINQLRVPGVYRRWLTSGLASSTAQIRSLLAQNSSVSHARIMSHAFSDFRTLCHLPCLSLLLQPASILHPRPFRTLMRRTFFSCQPSCPLIKPYLVFWVNQSRILVDKGMADSIRHRHKILAGAFQPPSQRPPCFLRITCSNS